MSTIKELTIVAQQRETKDENGKVKKFLTYYVINKDNSKLDVRFVKEAFTKAPKEIGRYLVKVDRANMNISKKYVYDRLYIQDVISVEVAPTTRPQDDDLPF